MEEESSNSILHYIEVAFLFVCPVKELIVFVQPIGRIRRGPHGRDDCRTLPMVECQRRVQVASTIL